MESDGGDFRSAQRPRTLDALNSALTEIFVSRGETFMPIRDRERYSAAVGTLTVFFHDKGFDQVVVKNFEELTNALDELSIGVVRDFLRPTKAQNRACYPDDLWSLRALISCAIDYLVSVEKKSARDAAKEVVNAAPAACEVAAKKARDIPEAARKWREKFLRGEVSAERAQMRFDDRARLYEIVRGKLENTGEEPNSKAMVQLILEGALVEAVSADDGSVFSLKTHLGKKPLSEFP